MEVLLFPSSLCLVGRIVVCVGIPIMVWCGVGGSLLVMASIEDLWSRFSLTEEEENGVDVPQKKEVSIVRLAAKFFTKRVVNAEAVSRTFKPLLELIREMKIRDIGGNILLFEFDDALDLERVLELEPWTYDKSLVVFQRVVDVESAPLLPFDSVTF